ncbi:MAG: hypothetical protein H6P97_185, partial [Candidatus Aminicenantes bacterium]|nr:hypothetical protein [Candidatus Aminicenantes bacterium]
SQEGMNSRGMRPPLTSFENSYAPLARGSNRPMTRAYWPEPPVCFLWV